jgi:hypothetical protein
MIAAIVTELVQATTLLLGELGSIFTDIVDLVYDSTGDALTELGVVIVATAGFALAWAGIRFVFGFVSRLLNKTRAGA